MRQYRVDHDVSEGDASQPGSRTDGTSVRAGIQRRFYVNMTYQMSVMSDIVPRVVLDRADSQLYSDSKIIKLLQILTEL